MMKINRANCEQYLLFVLGQLLSARVKTVSDLFALPKLKAMLFAALDGWSWHVACLQKGVVELRIRMDISHEEMCSSFVAHIFNEGTKKPWPQLNALLNVLHEDGAAAVPAYMMRIALNHARDMKRSHRYHSKHRGEVHCYDEDGNSTVMDPGEMADPASGEDLEALCRREAFRGFIAQLGENFVPDLVILSDALGIRRDLVAKCLFAGRQTALVYEMIKRLNSALHYDCTAQCRRLMEAARTYVLPDRFRRDYKALLAHLYRMSSGAARQRLARRTGLAS